MFWQKKNFLYLFKKNYLKFNDICGYTKCRTNKFFFPSSSGAVFGSRMDKNQDPGYNIPDPQHCLELELGSAEVLRHGEHIGQDLVREAHQPTVLDVRRLVLSTKILYLQQCWESVTFWCGSGYL